MLKNIPPCYSFVFGPELKIEGKIVHKNVFQFYVHYMFHAHLVNNIDEILQKYPWFGEQKYRKGLKDLIGTGKIDAYLNLYRYDIPTNDRSVLYNLFLPEYNASIPVNAFLQEECMRLQYFLFLLEAGSIHYSESEEGKKHRGVSLYHQGVVPRFLGSPPHFSVELWNRDHHSIAMVLWSAKDADKKVTAALESVIGSVDKDLLHSNYVSLRGDYIDIRIFGYHTGMFIDASSGNDPNETWTIVSKHEDCPLQAVALFAAMGTLLRLNS